MEEERQGRDSESFVVIAFIPFVCFSSTTNTNITADCKPPILVVIFEPDSILPARYLKST